LSWWREREGSGGNLETLGLFSGSQKVPPTFTGKALGRGWKEGSDISLHVPFLDG